MRSYWAQEALTWYAICSHPLLAVPQQVLLGVLYRIPSALQERDGKLRYLKAVFQAVKLATGKAVPASPAKVSCLAAAHAQTAEAHAPKILGRSKPWCQLKRIRTPLSPFSADP